MGTKPKKLLIKISTIIALSLLLTFANTNVYAGITLPSGMENIYTTQDPVVESILLCCCSYYSYVCRTKLYGSSSRSKSRI